MVLLGHPPPGRLREELQLKEKNSDVTLGAVSVEHESIAGPTKFMIGTEQGTVLMCNCKAKNPQDRVGTAYHGHHCPVLADPTPSTQVFHVHRRLVRATTETKSPIMTTRYHGTYLTGGTWSPTRPGVFFTIKMHYRWTCGITTTSRTTGR